MKVNYITAKRAQEKQALYRACEKVFEIPPWDLVEKALAGEGASLQNWAEETRSWYEESSTPFSGPTVFKNLAGGEVLIITNGDRRISVTSESVTVDFVRDGRGSTVAAGEVIGHIWANDPGDRLHGIVARTDEGDIDIIDYNGPVHPQLGRTCYDSDFRRKFEAGEIKWFQQAKA